MKICTNEPERMSCEDKISTTTEIILCFLQKVKFRKSLSHITFLEYISWVVVAVHEKACPEKGMLERSVDNGH